MAGFEVKFNDKSDIVKSDAKSELIRRLEKCGLFGEGAAKKLCPVDTGRLRNSITHTVDTGEPAAYIGTNVEYAAYVELGTSKQQAQPYLKPAVANNTATYKSILRNG